MCRYSDEEGKPGSSDGKPELLGGLQVMSRVESVSRWFFGDVASAICVDTSDRFTAVGCYNYLLNNGVGEQTPDLSAICRLQ